jgi:hypothetical protein
MHLAPSSLYTTTAVAHIGRTNQLPFRCNEFLAPKEAAK